jgi:hypothetical protein
MFEIAILLIERRNLNGQRFHDNHQSSPATARMVGDVWDNLSSRKSIIPELAVLPGYDEPQDDS